MFVVVVDFDVVAVIVSDTVSVAFVAIVVYFFYFVKSDRGNQKITKQLLS